MGVGVEAVKTVMGEPPPWGVSATLRTLTPIVAQSSLEASCITNATVPFCVAPEPLEDDPEVLPHPTNNSGSVATTNNEINREILLLFTSMTNSCD
jgi:hypothetical protein